MIKYDHRLECITTNITVYTTTHCLGIAIIQRVQLTVMLSTNTLHGLPRYRINQRLIVYTILRIISALPPDAA